MRSMKWMLVGVACLVASPLFAAKPYCGDGKCQGNEPTTCQQDCTGSGACEVPGIVETEAQWRGDIQEPQLRPCLATNVKPNGNNGTYACEAGSPAVQYMLGIGVQTARKGDAELCQVFSNITLTPDNYWYSWFDNCCEDDACTIRINSWFTSPEVIPETDGKADFIRLRAFAEAVGPFTDANPFVDEQWLNVDEINISFSAAGSNKNLAVCHYSSDLGNLGNVRFHSIPRVTP